MAHKQSIRSARKANAIGFAKRHLRKNVTGSDVYEYSPVENKRAVIKDTSRLDPDALRAHIMSTGEDGDADILSEDDEEIESEDAFEESDEDRFAGFSFAKKRSLPKKLKTRPCAAGPADIDLNEDDDGTSARTSEQYEESENTGDSEEYLDVLDVLDGRGEPDLGDDQSQPPSEETDDGFAPSEADQQPDAEALDHLGAFVTQLSSGKKRKAHDDVEAAIPTAGTSPRKRRMLKERTEAGVEGEFGVQAASDSRLRLEDLLTPLASTTYSLEALKKSTKLLVKGDALSAPLPRRTQDRVDREAAYEQTREEVDKWKATMKKIKEADHLSFPLQVPQKVNPSSSGLAAKFTPSNALESAVDKLLKAADMLEEGDIAKTEELKMNHLSVEEVAARRAQLRKMRDLMFRAEAKAKRIAKIKSKTYRRIQRKTHDRVRGLIEEAEGRNDENDKEEQMKREMERARERATLRHKNTGKWAKAMKNREELEVDQRRDIEEMLEKGEQLTAKIQGHDGSEDGDDDDGDDGVDSIRASAFEELRKLGQKDDSLLQADKGVFAMKFMQDAMAREAQKVDAAADSLRDEVERMGHESDGQMDDEDLVTEPRDTQIQRIGGRVIYRPGQILASPRPIAPSDSSSTLKSSEPAPQSSQITMRSSPPVPPDDLAKAPSPPRPLAADTEPNPWLTFNRSNAKQPRRENEVLIGKHSADAVRSKNSMKKRLLKGEEERRKARDDAIVEISMEATLKLSEDTGLREDPSNTSSVKAKTKENSRPNERHVDAAFEDSDENSEIEAQEHHIKSKGKSAKAFRQRDLVALAFAGDNVVQDFRKLKEREVAADAPREDDYTLPGWGSWGGTGTKRNPHAKRFIKKFAGINPTSRADHGKPHLIISEKKDKKAAKYLTKDLPFPYTSKAQFEKSIEVPVGTEWNTRVGFQRQTLPRVVKKMGTVINPLEKVL